MYFCNKDSRIFKGNTITFDDALDESTNKSLPEKNVEIFLSI